LLINNAANLERFHLFKADRFENGRQVLGIIHLSDKQMVFFFIAAAAAVTRSSHDPLPLMFMLDFSKHLAF